MMVVINFVISRSSPRPRCAKLSFPGVCTLTRTKGLQSNPENDHVVIRPQESGISPRSPACPIHEKTE